MRLNVVGQHEHAQPGMLRAQLGGGKQSLVGERGRHADVDHGNLRNVQAYDRQQLVDVRRLAHHVEPGFCQQSSEALSKQDRIVGDDYPHVTARAG